MINTHCPYCGVQESFGDSANSGAVSYCKNSRCTG